MSPTSCSTLPPDASTSPARRRAASGGRTSSTATALAAEYTFAPEMPTYPFGTHVAVVDVDTETGQVWLRRHVAVDDAGTLLNPLLAEGQIHGGIAQGVAQALLEAIHYDDDGQPRTTNFADYPVISAPPSCRRSSSPRWRLRRSPTSWAPRASASRARSASIPSVYNAVIDALAHLGIRHLETPLTPERIWRAVRARAATRFEIRLVRSHL